MRFDERVIYVSVGIRKKRRSFYFCIDLYRSPCRGWTRDGVKHVNLSTCLRRFDNELTNTIYRRTVVL